VLTQKALTWGWYLDQSIPRLYQWDGQAWNFHIQIPWQMHRFHFQKYNTPAEPIQQWENWDWATVTHTQQTVIVTGIGLQAQLIIEQESHWIASFLHMPYTYKWNLKITDEPDTKTLKQALRKGDTVAMSDRSFMQKAGAAAWTIDWLTQEGRSTGTSFTSGKELNQSTFWSQLAGIYGIVFMLNMMAEWEEDHAVTKVSLGHCQSHGFSDLPPAADMVF